MAGPHQPHSFRSPSSDDDDSAHTGVPTHHVGHHLYARPGDLRPFCGIAPGRDPLTGEFHAGHDRDTLIEFVGTGAVCCAVCLLPAGLAANGVDEETWAVAERTVAEKARRAARESATAEFWAETVADDEAYRRTYPDWQEHQWHGGSDEGARHDDGDRHDPDSGHDPPRVCDAVAHRRRARMENTTGVVGGGGSAPLRGVCAHSTSRAPGAVRAG